jgi:hypothetical protein
MYIWFNPLFKALNHIYSSLNHDIGLKGSIKDL